MKFDTFAHRHGHLPRRVVEASGFRPRPDDVLAPHGPERPQQVQVASRLGGGENRGGRVVQLANRPRLLIGRVQALLAFFLNLGDLRSPQKQNFPSAMPAAYASTHQVVTPTGHIGV